MNNEDWIKEKIQHWEKLKHQASQDGDFKAWEFAEREVQNYQQMLKRWQS